MCPCQCAERTSGSPENRILDRRNPESARARARARGNCSRGGGGGGGGRGGGG